MKRTIGIIPSLLAGFALAIMAGNAYAANVTWGSAQNITADTDVSTTGALVRALNLTALNPNTAAGGNASFTNNLNTDETINGVTFVRSPRTNATILASVPMIFDNGDMLAPIDASRVGPSIAVNQFSGFGGPSSAATGGTPVNGPFSNLVTVAYQRLLSSAWWNDGDYLNPTTTARYTLTLTNLTIGRKYNFQVWVNDTRLNNLGQNNPALYTEVSDGVTSVQLQHNVNDALGGIGQHAIGTFTADATSQVLTLTGGNAPGADIDTTSCTALINAYQLRDITSTNQVTGGGGFCPTDPGVSVGISGTAVGVDYQLQRDGVDVGAPVNGTGAPLSFGIFNTPGVYTVIESNTVTTVTGYISGSAVVSPNQVPAIVTSPAPASGTSVIGDIRVYSVSATGSGLSYQWRHEGTNISNGGGYAGVTTPTLTISPLVASHAGNYDCVVSGTCSPAVTSSAASLTLVPPRNLTWVGGGANLWDTTTANWTGDATIFGPSDNVTINDSGNNSPAMDLVGTITPLAITVNNPTKDYTIGSTTTGNLSGFASLVKSGAGKLTLSTSNSFTGKATVNGGTLSINADNRLGAVPSTATADQLTLNGATLEVTASITMPANRGTTLGASGATYSIPAGLSFTNASITTGAGGFNKTGDGDLTMSSLNTYTGNVTVNGGVLRGLTTQNSGGNSVFGAILSTRNITVNNGAILSFDRGNIFAGGNSTAPTPSPHIIVNAGSTLRTRINDGNNFGKITLNGATFDLGTGFTGTPYETYGAAILTDTVTVGGSAASTIINDGFSLYSAINLGHRDSTNGVTFDVADATGNPNADLVVNAPLWNAAPHTNLVGSVTNSLVKTGAGTMHLNGVSLYTGLTVISNGVLAGSGSIPGSVVVYGNGKIGGGADAGIGTFTVGGNVTLDGGGAYVRVDRSGPSSDSVSVAGTLINNGSGTITVNNIGAALQVGDTFTIFSQPVSGGNALNISGAGITWTNQLAVNGTIKVLSLTPPLPTYGTNITSSVSGNSLTLSWPATHQGWILQSQTNSLNVGIGATWTDVAGSDSVTQVVTPINPANPTVFYRLRHP